MKPHLLLAVLACLGAWAAFASAQGPQAKYSARELQAALAKLNGRIQGYTIVYDAAAARGGIADGGTAGEMYVHLEMTAHSPSFFSHWSAKKTSRFTAERDPLQQRLTISGESAVTQYPADRAFRRFKMRDQLPGSAPREIVFLALGWWPFEAWKTPQLVPGTALVLPDVAKSDKYQIWPKQALVAGRWCHALEHANRDRLWLDTERGCMIMAREIISPQCGTVAQRIEAAEPIEVAPGIWAPKRVRNLLFDRRAERLAVDSQLLFRQITVNDPPSAEAFDFKPKPGSIELAGANFVQCEPDGLDFLDETAARLKQFSRYGRLEKSRGGSAKTFVCMMCLSIAFGVVMTVRGMKHPSGILAKLRSHVD